MGCKLPQPLLVFERLILWSQLYLSLSLIAPIPRKPLESEKLFICVGPNSTVQKPTKLPCWQDNWYARKIQNKQEGDPAATGLGIENPEIFMSLVVPAFNEEQRLETMLVEAIEYLQTEFGRTKQDKRANSGLKHRSAINQSVLNGHTEAVSTELSGWEILVVSDGSTDKTIDTALNCAMTLKSNAASSIRIIDLKKNRGKGGAVTHGMRHVRGQYVIFADADGASKFEDLGKLLRECRRVQDAEGRGVAVGSRAHLVGSEAVVKVSRHISLRGF